MLTLGTVIAVSGIVLVAAVLQRAVGFGDALLAVPLMTFLIPTKSAVVVAFLMGTATTAWLLLRFWPQVEWRTTRLLGAGTAIGAPVGVVILSVASAVALRVTLGVIVCIAAAWIIVSSRWLNRLAPHRPSRTLAMGVASGVLSTSLATSGPPLVYELRRTGFVDDPFRGTISAAFMISSVIGLPLLAVAGLITAFDLTLAAASLVSCVIGIALGSWISARMQTAHFIWAADLLLLATGAVTIAKAVS
jgi:uncharacterized membrane protein YfcA